MQYNIVHYNIVWAPGVLFRDLRAHGRLGSRLHLRLDPIFLSLSVP